MAPKSPHKKPGKAKKDGKRRRIEKKESPVRDTHSQESPNSDPVQIHVEPITLETPIKSPNDPKFYKVIQLGNGLQALLISDILCLKLRDKQNRESVEARIEKFNQDVLGLPPSKPLEDEDVEDSDSDTANRDHVKKCSCENSTAAVALCVGGGSMHEPAEVEGLAHLCEHMIFCGTAKYPKAEEFDLFLAANGGFTNGKTFCDHTIFNFHVNQGELPQALEMFSSFFTAPLMSLEYLVKEKGVVDQEFNYKKCDDDEKRAHVVMQTGKKGHPVSRFSWGTVDTLRTRDGKDETLHKLLYQFRNQYYGSESMHLVIQASESFETLEKLVVQYFEHIPRSSVPKSNQILEPMPFDTPEFRKLYFMIPTQDFNLLYVTWEFPAEPASNYKSKPLAYIQRILSSESKGGLSHYLREKNLINSMTCSSGVMEHEKTDASILFHVSFNITNIETETIQQIMESFFSFTKFLIRHQPQEWYLDEFKSIRATEFHYLDDHVAKDNALYLAESLRKFGPKDCIIGDLLITKWEPNLIQEYLKLIVPNTANYMILSQQHPDARCNQIEPYFGTKFGVSDIPAQLMTKWLEAEPEPEFRFYKRNVYLTTSFCLAKDDGNSDEFPQRVYKTDDIEMWHLYDVSSPEAQYRLLFMSNAHLEDIQTFSSLSLWARFLQRLLLPRLYGATEAKLAYSANRGHLGIELEVQGFSQKLGFLITEIMIVVGKLRSTQTTKISKELFETEKVFLRRQLKNEFTNPERLGRQLRSRITLNTCYTSLEMHKALKLVTISDFNKFCESFMNSIFVIGLALGNVSKSRAKKVAAEIVNINYNSVAHDDFPQILSTELNLGERILRVRSLDKCNPSSSISSYYQIGAVNLRSCLIGQLVVEITKEHTFQRLRVEKNLGYKVELSLDVNFASNTGITFTVASQSNEFTGTQIKNEMDSFLEEFFRTRIQPMTESEFQTQKDNFGYRQLDTKQYFKEIIKQECFFDRSEAENKEMRNIGLREFQSWYEKYLIPSCKESRMRKLVIQVVGYGDKEFPVEVIQNWSIKKCRAEPAEPGTSSPLVILLPENADDKHIKDIEKFHKCLPVLPKHKIV